MRFGTKIIHNENSVDPTTGAVSVPIYQVSTYHQEDVDAGQEFDYTRSGNPTRKALEQTVAILENGNYAYAFASGMAATSSVLSIFSAGDHLIVCEDVYGGTFRVLNQLFPRFGIEVTFVDASNLEQIQKAIQPNTKGIYLETPSNPLLKVTDLKGAISIAKEAGVLTIIDNTFMSPYLQRPLDLGADIVLHSATKFLGGHSDVLAGVVIVKDEELGKRIYQIQNGYGAVLSPMESWILLRGIKTLKVRMDVQQKNAEILAQWFSEQEEVAKVYYPGIKDHPGREIHLAQADGPGAVFSVEFKTEDIAKRFLKEVKLGVVAVSLGGVETILSYPVKMSHAAMPEEERLRLGITNSLVRISPGIEDVEDLLEDYKRALKLK